MKKLAIIHTSPATVSPLKSLANELVPEYEVVSLMDDSILPELAANGGNIGAVESRWVQYAQIAEQVGAEAILNACSSIGELVARAQPHVSVPIVRIDEAMAEEAVQRGERIGVAATLATTLEPTLRLLRQKATEAGRSVELKSALVDSAYQKLIAGDKEGHDNDLVEALSELAASVDVVVLAQASMARVLPRLPEAQQEKFFSSPRLGMERVKRILTGTAG